MSIIASKIEFLDYIHKHKVVTPIEMVGVFGYTESAARQKLSRLYQKGLLDRLHRGEYIVTDAAIDKLLFFREREEQAKRAKRK